jgi:hypothetical protein
LNVWYGDFFRAETHLIAPFSQQVDHTDVLDTINIFIDLLPISSNFSWNLTGNLFLVLELFFRMFPVLNASIHSCIM